MRGDDEFFAALCKQLGRPVPPPTPYRERFVTAAIISQPALVLATIEDPLLTRRRLVEKRSRMFELIDRSKLSIMALSNELTRFVQKQGIDEIFLRSHSEKGKYPGKPFNFKIEAALQLVPGLQVTFVNTQSVSAWVQRENPAVPEGDHGLRARWFERQRQAIEAALFVAHNHANPKFFSDGSAADD